MKHPTATASHSLRQLVLTLSLTLASTLSPACQARENLSTAVSLTASLPVALVLAAPVALFAGGTALVVKSVESTAQGTVWLLVRASDGAEARLQVTGRELNASAQAVGTVLSTTVLASGTVLYVATEAVAFVPNALGRQLLHHEAVQ